MNIPKNSSGRSSNDALSLPALKGRVSRAKTMRKKQICIYKTQYDENRFAVSKIEENIDKIPSLWSEISDKLGDIGVYPSNTYIEKANIELPYFDILSFMEYEIPLLNQTNTGELYMIVTYRENQGKVENLHIEPVFFSHKNMAHFYSEKVKVDNKEVLRIEKIKDSFLQHAYIVEEFRGGEWFHHVFMDYVYANAFIYDLTIETDLFSKYPLIDIKFEKEKNSIKESGVDKVIDAQLDFNVFGVPH